MAEKTDEASRAETIGALLDAKTAKKQRSESGSIYFFQSRRPLACLLFLLPLMLWYELGKLALPMFSGGVAPAPGVVESWLMVLFGQAGLVLGVLVSLLAVGVLLYLHHQSDEAAACSPITLAVMVGEVIGLSVILFLLGDAILLFVENQKPQPLSHLGDLFVNPKWHAVLLESLGAGLHEEILFRLVLFGFASQWLTRLIDDELIAVLVSGVLVSVLFAFAHCELSDWDASFRVSFFLLRFLASLVLCLLYRYRGLAIAVGVHVGFDVLASA